MMEAGNATVHRSSPQKGPQVEHSFKQNRIGGHPLRPLLSARGAISMHNFRRNVSLAKYSNYKIGGPARYFFEVTRADDIVPVIRKWNTLAKKKGIDPSRIFILGGGTNILIGDKGFDGLVVRLNVRFIKRKGVTVEAGAGTPMSNLLSFAAREGLRGLEWAGGLPGTVGGALRGNAGAFGGEMKDVVKSVESVNRDTSRKMVRSRAACRFGYRTNIFKTSARNEIIVRAAFALKKGNKKKIRMAIREKIAYRKARHPLEYPNIGSIFKNVPVGRIARKYRIRAAHVIKNDPFPIVPTGFLIEQAGLKGTTRGGAMISTRHSNFIVNTGRARARHVEELIALVKKELKKKFGVIAEEEIVRL